jgi:hypothetical protein
MDLGPAQQLIHVFRVAAVTAFHKVSTQRINIAWFCHCFIRGFRNRIRTPIVLNMEDSKASRRGKLQFTEEELKDSQKLSAKLLKGWPQDDLVKRGVIEVGGHKYYLYLPKTKSYSVKNTNNSDADFDNTSTLISVDQKGDGRIFLRI